MTFVKIFFPAALSLLLATAATGQKRFVNCAAAFLDERMIVNEYSPDGFCEIDPGAKGQLTVQTADLSPERSIPTGKIEFRIAIRDGNSKTLLAFSDRSYRQIDIRQLLDRCQPGDTIVLLTTDAEYALPHHEIRVRKAGN